MNVNNSSRKFDIVRENAVLTGFYLLGKWGKRRKQGKQGNGEERKRGNMENKENICREFDFEVNKERKII